MLLAFVTMTGNFSGVPLAFLPSSSCSASMARVTLRSNPGASSMASTSIRAAAFILITLLEILPRPAAALSGIRCLQDEVAPGRAAGVRAGEQWHRGAAGTHAAQHPSHPVCQRGWGYASAYALTTGNFNLVTIRVASLVSSDIFLEPNMAAALAVILMVLLRW